jgi:hypothetical protein
MVAAIWGYDAIASLFPYLQNSLVLKPSRTGIVSQDRSQD